ncbi:MAG: hypothetical protein GY869_01130 [Planctomycetes bacterium]|nr:hypothetical protein [Planctomycetota bacterium]
MHLIDTYVVIKETLNGQRVGPYIQDVELGFGGSLGLGFSAPAGKGIRFEMTPLFQAIIKNGDDLKYFTITAGIVLKG